MILPAFTTQIALCMQVNQIVPWIQSVPMFLEFFRKNSGKPLALVLKLHQNISKQQTFEAKHGFLLIFPNKIGLEQWAALLRNQQQGAFARASCRVTSVIEELKLLMGTVVNQKNFEGYGKGRYVDMLTCLHIGNFSRQRVLNGVLWQHSQGFR